MKKHFSPLFNTHLVEWILSFGLAIPSTYFLDYIFRVLYPSKIDDMGYMVVRQLQMKLILLGVLIIIVATLVDTIGVFRANWAEGSNDKEKTNLTYSNLLFRPSGITGSFSRVVVILVVVEKIFIASMMIYLTQNSFRTLNDSMDFQLSGPILLILVAHISLIINCIWVFCLLLFSLRWSYSWIQWVGEKTFLKFVNGRFYSLTLLVISLLFRSLHMALLIAVINALTAFTGEFFTLIGITIKINLLLGLWIGIFFCLIWLIGKYPRWQVAS